VVRAELPQLRKALAPKSVIDPATLTQAERLQWEGALARTAVNVRVEALAAAGTPIKQIARATGIARQTVLRILRGVRHDVFRSRKSSLYPWQLRLEAEWDAGCRNGSELWRRIRGTGFTGSLRVVTEWTTKRRREEEIGQPTGASVSARSIARDMTSGTARSLFGKSGSITRHSESVRSYRLIQRLPSETLNHDHAKMGIPFTGSRPSSDSH
jgi:transposase